jgi:hypothetical protein
MRQSSPLILMEDKTNYLSSLSEMDKHIQGLSRFIGVILQGGGSFIAGGIAQCPGFSFQLLITKEPNLTNNEPGRGDGNGPHREVEVDASNCSHDGDTAQTVLEVKG